MDYELLVDEQIEDGKSLLEGLIHDGFDVTVAFWARTGEEGLWHLYIGSNSLRAMSLADAYRVVYGALRRIPDTQIFISKIKMIDADDAVSRSAIAIRDRRSARLPIRYHGKDLGGMAIEEAYLYPRAGTMTRSEVLQTVTGLMNRTGVLAPSLVTLRDGSQFQALPVGVQMNVTGDLKIGSHDLVVVFHDFAASTDRSIPVDDVAGIM